MRARAASRPPGGQAFPRERRVAARGDFRRAYDEGARLPGPLVVVFARPRPAGGLRLGITATRRVGGAVVRNRARRRVREIFRRWAATAPAADVDLVVNVSARGAKAPYDTLADELARLLARAVAGGRAR